MKPTAAIDIIARDKTGAGIKEVEKKLGKAGARAGSAFSREGGFAKVGKLGESFAKVRQLGLGFDNVGHSLGMINLASTQAAEGVAGLTRGVFSFGGVSKVAFGGAAEGAVAAAGAVAGLAVAVAGLGVATYLSGEKWAKTRAEIGETARTIGMSAAELQRARGAAERFGVTGEQVDSAYAGLSDTLYDAQYGANNLALGAMNQLGIKLKKNKDGVIDYADAMDQVADAIARQKDPAVQRKLAAVLGVSSMLPALRQGSGALKAERADVEAGGSVASEADIAKAERVRRENVRLRQSLAGAGKPVADAAIDASGFMAGKGVGIVRRGAQAGRDIVRGGPASFAEATRQVSTEATQAAGPIRGMAHAIRELSQAAASARGGGRADRTGQAMTFFQSQGWTAEQAAGIVANLKKESGLNPAAVGDSGLAYGLNQAHPDRQADFKARFGKSMKGSSFEDQLAFVQYELTQGKERAAGDRLRQARTAQEAGEVVSRRYERPRYADAEATARGALAQRIQVDISMRGAPPGTVARVSGGRDVDVKVAVARSLPEAGGR